MLSIFVQKLLCFKKDNTPFNAVKQVAKTKFFLFFLSFLSKYCCFFFLQHFLSKTKRMSTLWGKKLEVLLFLLKIFSGKTNKKKAKTYWLPLFLSMATLVLKVYFFFFSLLKTELSLLLLKAKQTNLFECFILFRFGFCWNKRLSLLLLSFHHQHKRFKNKEKTNKPTF